MSESTEREAMQALMRQLRQKGEPGLVSAYCPKHHIITGSRLVAVTPLDRYAFERFDYGKPGEPKLIRTEMTRMGCPQCAAEGFRGAPLSGLSSSGAPAEELLRWAKRADDDSLTPDQNEFAMNRFHKVAQEMGLSDEEALARWGRYLDMDRRTRARATRLDGLGLPSEEHHGHATTNFHAAERSAQYAVENCDIDELRSGLINAGAAAAHAYSEGNERTEARAMALADRMTAGFRQKCLIKRKG